MKMDIVNPMPPSRPAPKILKFSGNLQMSRATATKHINVMFDGLLINSPAAMPMLPNSRIGEWLPHHRILADYSLPSWEGQVQTELPGKDEGDEPQAQER